MIKQTCIIAGLLFPFSLAQAQNAQPAAPSPEKYKAMAESANAMVKGAGAAPPASGQAPSATPPGVVTAQVQAVPTAAQSAPAAQPNYAESVEVKIDPRARSAGESLATLAARQEAAALREKEKAAQPAVLAPSSVAIHSRIDETEEPVLIGVSGFNHKLKAEFSYRNASIVVDARNARLPEGWKVIKVEPTYVELRSPKGVKKEIFISGAAESKPGFSAPGAPPLPIQGLPR